MTTAGLFVINPGPFLINPGPIMIHEHNDDRRRLGTPLQWSTMVCVFGVELGEVCSVDVSDCTLCRLRVVVVTTL